MADNRLPKTEGRRKAPPVTASAYRGLGRALAFASTRLRGQLRQER